VTRDVVRRVLRLLIIPAVALLVVFSLAAPDAGSAEPSTTTSQIPLDLTMWVTCTVEPGEVVTLSGSLMALTHQTTSRDGLLHTYVKYNPANVSGVGSVTGATFRGTGVSGATTIQRPAGETTVMSIENFRLITAGPRNNVTFHLNLQLVIAPDGSITARVDNAVATCR
jgi:hypothetical protein